MGLGTSQPVSKPQRKLTAVGLNSATRKIRPRSEVLRGRALYRGLSVRQEGCDLWLRDKLHRFEA